MRTMKIVALIAITWSTLCLFSVGSLALKIKTLERKVDAIDRWVIEQHVDFRGSVK